MLLVTVPSGPKRELLYSAAFWANGVPYELVKNSGGGGEGGGGGGGELRGTSRD